MRTKVPKFVGKDDGFVDAFGACCIASVRNEVDV